MNGLHVFLALGVSAATAMACGGGGGAIQPATTPTSTPTSTPTPTSTSLSTSTPTSTSTSTSTPTSPSTPTSTPTSTSPVHVDMKAPIPSALGADLQALGLDPRNLPPIEKLDPKALRGVMKLLAKSLGGKCADCHTEGDFAASTRRKKIAARMWNEFAVKLTAADGGPIFCDSCHQGRIVQLDRTDKKALAKWMDASFVDGLKRKDGKAEECESCHVDQDMHFLAAWGR